MIVIGYNVYGMSYFQCRTDKDSEFSRGALKGDDIQSTVEFTEQEPLIGGYGYEDSNRLMTAVGFWRNKCIDDAEPEPEIDKNDKSKEETTDPTGEKEAENNG